MLTRAVILLALALTGAAATARVTRTAPPAQPSLLSTLPWQIDAWAGRAAPRLDDETVTILGADDYLTRTYENDDALAGLYVGYWQQQRAGVSTHSPLHCLPGSGWQPLATGAVTVPAHDANGRPRDLEVARYLVERAGDRQLVLYWYQGRGRVIANEYVNRWFHLVDAVQRHRSDGALVRIMAPVPPGDRDAARAEDQAARFAAALFPWLDRVLPP